MSPQATGTLVSAILFTAVKFMTVVMELVAHERLVGYNVGGLITIGTTVSWIAFWSAYNCQRFLARLNTLEARLHQEIPSYGELCMQDGRTDAAREYARTVGSVVGVQRGRTLTTVE